MKALTILLALAGAFLAVVSLALGAGGWWLAVNLTSITICTGLLLLLALNVRRSR